MNKEEIAAEIASLEKAATQVPSRDAGRILMKVASLKRQQMKMEGGL